MAATKYYLSPIQFFHETTEPLLVLVALAGVTGIALFLPGTWGLVVMAFVLFVLGVVAVYRLMGPRLIPSLSYVGASPATNIVTHTTPRITDEGVLNTEKRYTLGYFTRVAISNRRKDGLRTASANEVHARVRYFDADKLLLYEEPTARWAGNAEIGALPEVDLQTTRIASGGQGTVDLVVRYGDEDEVYPWSNHGAGTIPMPIGAYFIHLEVEDLAVDVPLSLWLRMENLGFGHCTLTPLPAEP